MAAPLQRPAVECLIAASEELLAVACGGDYEAPDATPDCFNHNSEYADRFDVSSGASVAEVMIVNPGLHFKNYNLRDSSTWQIRLI